MVVNYDLLIIFFLNNRLYQLIFFSFLKNSRRYVTYRRFLVWAFIKKKVFYKFTCVIHDSEYKRNKTIGDVDFKLI